MRKLLIACTLSALIAPAWGQAARVLDDSDVRQGWHFYRDPAKEPKPEEPVPEAPPPKKEEPKPAPPVVVVTGAKTEPLTEEERQALCRTREGWTAACGFIDPGDDFEFQAKQRDILLQQMSMRPDVPEAVEAAQYYMKWVVSKASQAANMWYFNKTQNPDLDPTVGNPISEVGLALAGKAMDATQQEYFRIIREEGGVLLYFSREDCQFCHDQAPYTQRVAHTMGLKLLNIPLDGKCLPGFTGEACGDNITEKQMAPLQIKTVPTLFLFVPQATWIRLGTGLTPDAVIIANTVNFFSAYRAALVQGLDNGKGARPTVSFSPEHRFKPGAVDASGAASAAQPDRAKLLELMGYKDKPAAQ